MKELKVISPMLTGEHRGYCGVTELGDNTIIFNRYSFLVILNQKLKQEFLDEELDIKYKTALEFKEEIFREMMGAGISSMTTIALSDLERWKVTSGFERPMYQFKMYELEFPLGPEEKEYVYVQRKFCKVLKYFGDRILMEYSEKPQIVKFSRGNYILGIRPIVNVSRDSLVREAVYV